MSNRPGPKRREPPLSVKLASALIQLEDAKRRLGEIPPEVTKVRWQFDHHPPLGIRPINAAGTDWEPPQHEPSKLFWLWEQEHHQKTYGTNPATAVGSDRHNIDRTRRLGEKEEAFRRRILAKTEGGEPPPEKRKRGAFPKRPPRVKEPKQPKRSSIELERMKRKRP